MIAFLCFHKDECGKQLWLIVLPTTHYKSTNQVVHPNTLIANASCELGHVIFTSAVLILQFKYQNS